MMRIAIALIAAFNLASASAQEIAEYGGTKRDLENFIEEVRLDWRPPEQIDFTTGEKIRYGYWKRAPNTSPAGTVVHFNGRTEFIERNAYTYRDLTMRGYDVWTLDWRGQGFSARHVEGPMRERGHIDSFDTYVADAERVLEQHARLHEQPQPRILLAHSMGGQIGLRYLLRHPGAFQRAVLSSPLIRPNTGSVPLPIVRVVNWARVALGYGRACALTKTELWEPPFVLPADAVSDWVCGLYPDGDEWPFSRPEVTDYTHDGAKLATTECLVQRSRRGLAVGCPTSGWTRAAIVSTDEVIRKRDELKLPILILAAEEDTAVSTAAQAEFCAAVPSCTRVPIPGAGHELLIEEDGIREAFLACFDAFAADPTNGRETCPEIIAKLPKRTD